MKYLLIYIKHLGVYVFIIMGLSSCGEDFLNRTPPSSPSESEYYQNSDQIEGALVAAYSQFSSIANQLVTFADFKSDNFKNYQYVQYSYSTNNYERWESPFWGSLFQLIFRSNQVINNIPEEGVENKEQFIAEAKFLRAYAYFWLVRAYGKVPIVTKKINRSEAIDVERASVNDVYILIEEDLNYAINNLKQISPFGRANKYVAESILARVYIAQSGYPVNHDKYNDAIILLEDIIKNGGYQLEAKYSDIFSLDGEKGSEVIWSAIMDSDSKGKKHSIDYIIDPNGGARSLSEPEFASGENALLGNLWLSFEPGDVRRNLSLDTLSQDPNGIWQNQINNSKYKYGFLQGFGWTSDYIFVRYANILLLYAETLHMTGKSSIIEDKWKIINKIRKRAGLGEISANNDFMQVVLDERRHEFIWEGVRWFDLVRTNTFVQELKKVQKSDAADFWKYLPVPTSEMDIMEGKWENNEGY